MLHVISTQKGSLLYFQSFRRFVFFFLKILNKKEVL